jgi:hypothetical protein
VTTSRLVLPDLDVLDVAGLKALILSQHDELVTTHERLLSRENEIEHLKLLINLHQHRKRLAKINQRRALQGA